MPDVRWGGVGGGVVGKCWWGGCTGGRVGGGCGGIVVVVGGVLGIGTVVFCWALLGNNEPGSDIL